MDKAKLIEELETRKILHSEGLTDEEIHAIAEPFYSRNLGCHSCNISAIEEGSWQIEAFARAIEAAVMAKNQPKFKVGDKVTVKDEGSCVYTITAILERSYELDNCNLDEPTMEDELELAEEE